MEKNYYLLKVTYFDVHLQKFMTKSQLKICEPSQIKFVAKDYLIWFRSLPGVRSCSLDCIVLAYGETIIKELCL